MEFTVYITHADIQRLIQFTEKSPERFVVPYSDDGKSPYPLVDLADDYGSNLRLGLIRTDDKCLFLDSVNGQNRCAVHTYKPMVCKTYPFSVSENGEVIPITPYKCPRPLPPIPSEEKEMILTEIDQLFTEFDKYEALIKKWNSLKTPKKEFEILLDFLIHPSS